MAAIQPLPESGEAAFDHKGRRYTLALTHLAWATAQRACGLVDGQALARMQILRRVADGFDQEGYALFFGMLQRHHPEIATLEQAANLMEEVGPPAVEAIRLAMGISAPDPKDAAELREGERPPTAQTARKRKTRTKEKSTSVSVSAA